MLTPTSTFVVFSVGTSAFLSTLSTSVLELLAFFAASSNDCIGKITELFDDFDPSEIELLAGSTFVVIFLWKSELFEFHSVVFELSELLYENGSECDEALETRESLEVRFSEIFELLKT